MLFFTTTKANGFQCRTLQVQKIINSALSKKTTKIALNLIVPILKCSLGGFPFLTNTDENVKNKQLLKSMFISFITFLLFQNNGIISIKDMYVSIALGTYFQIFHYSGE